MQTFFASGSNDLRIAIDDFLSFCRIKNLSNCTVEFYSGRLLSFTRYLSGKDEQIHLKDIDQSMIRGFISSLMKAGYSTKTINHSIQALKAFFRFLVDEERVEQSPMVKVKLQKLERKIIETFTDDQIAAMLDVCNRKTFIGLRDYTILLTLLDTGLRVSELCGIELQSIDWESGFIRVLGKGRKERLVPFGSSLHRTLKEYIRRRGVLDREEHIFVTQFGEQINRHRMWRIIDAIGTEAGIKGVRVSPHTFRHTFAKNWILNGGDPFSLQRILGHTTQDMVSKYVNLAAGDLQTQHARFSPADRFIAPREKKRVLLK